MRYFGKKIGSSLYLRTSAGNWVSLKLIAAAERREVLEADQA
ncbi:MULTISPECIES: hypothetical protein [Paenibacillus]|nr:hypothetical protein [Paenibacillus rhizosphaerae]